MPREISDYKTDSTVVGEYFRPVPDLIPVVGLVTLNERVRKDSGESLREYYLTIPSKKDLLSLGTSESPEPADFKAWRRGARIGGRNAILAIYHIMPIPIASAILFELLK